MNGQRHPHTWHFSDKNSHAFSELATITRYLLLRSWQVSSRRKVSLQTNDQRWRWPICVDIDGFLAKRWSFRRIMTNDGQPKYHQLNEWAAAAATSTTTTTTFDEERWVSLNPSNRVFHLTCYSSCDSNLSPEIWPKSYSLATQIFIATVVFLQFCFQFYSYISIPLISLLFFSFYYSQCSSTKVNAQLNSNWLDLSYGHREQVSGDETIMKKVSAKKVCLHAAAQRNANATVDEATNKLHWGGSNGMNALRKLSH